MKFCAGYNFSVTTILCIHVNSRMILPTGVFCVDVLYRRFSFLVSWVGTHIACEDINATQVSHALSFIMEFKVDCPDVIQLHQISDLVWLYNWYAMLIKVVFVICHVTPRS